MQSGPPSSQSVLNSSSPSPSTSRPTLSWQPFLQVILFVIGLAFSYCDLMAELEMAETTNGIPQSAETLVGEADDAVAWFPLDRRLRDYRQWVHAEVAWRLASDAVDPGTVRKETQQEAEGRRGGEGR